MNCCGQWSFVIAMVAVNFALAITNALFKMTLNEGMNGVIILIYRHTISVICLTPIAFFRERKSRPKLTPSIMCHLFFNALIGLVLTQYFFLLGLQYTSPTFTCAFLNIVPAITLVLALPFGLEKVNIGNKAGKAKVVGTLVCISGAMVLTLYKGRTLVGSSNSSDNNTTVVAIKKKDRWGIGPIFPMASAVCFSSWFLLQSRIGKVYPCKYSSTAFMSLFSAFQSTILGLITEREFTKWILKDELEVTTVIIAGIVASGLCYVGMSWCVEHKGPVFTSAFSPLVQIFVAMFDFSFLHGKIYLGSVIGSILIVIGLYILLWGRNSEAQEMKQPQEGEEKDCNVRSQV
ncbi:hypothetical protein E1A91_D08G044700v1 [Gossypium mustelinum]|uniref:WAT1-related protein n=1 Tax=Gossypium mustelinum TaxID=34275 RepID=A0A5D2TRA1_GOSMU|nr:hypothetical protein E1A91_D08G044700v1 [Gossypium mustelinum]